MSAEFWFGYIVAGAKFFLLGMIWGQMRMAHYARRKLRELAAEVISK